MAVTMFLIEQVRVLSSPAGIDISSGQFLSSQRTSFLTISNLFLYRVVTVCDFHPRVNLVLLDLEMRS